MTLDWVNIEHIPSVKHCISVVMLHVVHPCQWSSMILGSGTVWKSNLCPSFPRGRLAGCLPHYHCLHLAIQKNGVWDFPKNVHAASCGMPVKFQTSSRKPKTSQFESTDLVYVVYCFLHVLSMFDIFTKMNHRFVQGGSQMSKQTCSRNHRDSFPTGVSTQGPNRS